MSRFQRTAYLPCRSAYFSGLLYCVVIMNRMRRDYSLGEFEHVVLLAILRLADSAYGVAIKAEIETCSGRQITPGALYTTLDRLERKGMICARVGSSTPVRGGRAKRFYTVSKKGRSRLLSAQTAFRRLSRGLDLLTEDANG